MTVPELNAYGVTVVDVGTDACVIFVLAKAPSPISCMPVWNVTFVKLLQPENAPPLTVCVRAGKEIDSS